MRILRRAVLILLPVLALLLVGVVLLWALQDRFIYHPRPLPPGPLPAELVALRFTTDQGAQVAYLRIASGTPGRFWLLCSGNGALAVDWAGSLDAFPRGDTLLLLDYPGYGACAGHPSPPAIRTSIAAAFSAAATALQRTPEQLTDDCGIVGYSLGSGPATQAAEDCRGCSRLILLAPFTSLHAMARRAVGWPICLLLTHDFDNQARLDAIMQRDRHPRLAICHGDEDEVVPQAMGRALAARYPEARFLALAGMAHNDAPSGLASALAAVGAQAR